MVEDRFVGHLGNIGPLYGLSLAAGLASKVLASLNDGRTCLSSSQKLEH